MGCGNNSKQACQQNQAKVAACHYPEPPTMQESIPTINNSDASDCISNSKPAILSYPMFLQPQKSLVHLIMEINNIGRTKKNREDLGPGPFLSGMGAWCMQ